MIKEIKDYLHLYLGCKLLRTDYKKVFTPSSIVSWFDHAMDTELFKPILRPLSSMTEDEALECHIIEHPLDKNSTTGKMVIDYYSRDPFTTPEPFRYLLSKHFDLFQLIEAGLAIDVTKLETAA